MTQEPLDQDQSVEPDLGEDARGRAAAEALKALARACRSYTIYDPHNDAIRSFLEDVRDNFNTLLNGYGEVDLEVRPYELVWQGQTVYLDRERERSLAFKLFRDGVRRLRIEPGVTWHELTSLLGVLSVRYVGVLRNPAEDDVVTLLWKAGFQSIQVEAVEGFVPDDEDPGGPVEAAQDFGAGHHQVLAEANFPPDFDLPPPALPSGALPTWRAISDEEKATLATEDDSTQIAGMVVDAVAELMEAVRAPADPTSLDDVLPLIRDARGLLLTEEHMQSMLRMADILEAAMFRLSEQEAEAVDTLLDSFLGVDAFSRVLRSVGKDVIHPPIALYELLDRLRVEPVPTLLDQLDAERGVGARRLLRQLIERYLPEHTGAVVARFHDRSGGVAADLLRVLTRMVPDFAQQSVATLAQGDDIELQLEFLTQLRYLPRGPATRPLLVHLLHARSEEVRQRALDTIVEMGEAGSFLTLQHYAEARTKEGADADELAIIGQAMAKVAPRRALETFTEWVRPSGLLGRLVRSGQGLRLTAAGGLQVLPGEEAEELLRSLIERGDEVESAAARKALVRRRGLEFKEFKA